MIKIEFGNVNARINGLEAYPAIAVKLARTLSYTTGGFGAPVETFSLFSVKTNTTYAGLIPYVIRELNKNRIPFEMVDRREKPKNGNYYSLADGIQLRDYQQEVINNVATRTVIGAATGGGKTIICAALIVHAQVKKAVIVSPELALSYQTRDELSRFLGIHVGILTGQDKDFADVMVVTPDAALKQKTVVEEAEVILYDECQFLGATTIFNTARMAKKAYYRYALSATPWRDGTDSIKIYAAINVLNPKAYITASTLIRKGKLTPVDIYFIEQKDVCGWAGNYNNTYVKQIIENEDRNQKALKAIEIADKNGWGSSLVLLGRVEHGNKILSMIREKFNTKSFKYTFEGVTYTINEAEFVHGGTELNLRNAILQAARECKVRYIVSTSVFDAGISVSPLGTLILLGAGKSSTRAFQRIGRVLRLFDGKERAKVFDFADKNLTFYKHYLTRKALYSVEPEFKKNMYLLDENFNVIKKAS